MRLEVLPLEDADADAYNEVCWGAFKNQLMSIIYPNGFTEAARKWSKNHLLDDKHHYPQEHKFSKVIDHDLPDDDPNGKAVGVSWWRIFPHPRTDAELDAAEKEYAERMGDPPDADPRVFKKLHQAMGDGKREHLGGQPYVLCSTLAVLPSYQRKGVGGMLMDWGLEFADELGLPSYLEASPMGKGLYVKKGYVEIKRLEFDPREFGMEGDLPHV